MPLTKRSTKGSPLSIEEMDANWDYVTPGEYTEVAISSAQILSLNTTPVELLPSLAGNQYYEFYGYLEYTHVTTAYSYALDSYVAIRSNSENLVAISGDFLAAQSTNRIMPFSSLPGFSASNDILKTPIRSLGNSIELHAISVPTLGDGTLLVKIWYKVKTFGSEL